jgi:hypothetical protein
LGAGLTIVLALDAAPGLPALAALCLGGLVLYAAAAWALGAVTGEDLARLKAKI